MSYDVQIKEGKISRTCSTHGAYDEDVKGSSLLAHTAVPDEWSGWRNENWQGNPKLSENTHLSSTWSITNSL
jgi:hypothetical protein